MAALLLCPTLPVPVDLCNRPALPCPKNPTDELTGSIDVEYGELERQRIEAAVGGPLLPGFLNVRVAALTEEREIGFGNASQGWSLQVRVENLTDEVTDNTSFDVAGAAGVFYFAPTPPRLVFGRFRWEF